MSIKPYAKYFGEIIKNNGQPQLNDDQFRRMMNIVYLDGKLAGMECLRTKLKRLSNDYRFDMDYHLVSKQLTEITGNTEPGELLSQMIRKSY